MTLTREEAQESKEMESLRVHADALLSLSSPAASSSPSRATAAIGNISKPPSSTTTPAARRALAAEGVFECKTCSKRFSSFQALGGHRTSHTRLQARMLLEQPADHGAAERDRARVHECAVCGLEFSMGQALGGHMRRHRGETTSTAVPGPGDSSSSGGTQPDAIVMPDLNYPPMEDCGGGDGQESSADHHNSNHPLLDLLL